MVQRISILQDQPFCALGIVPRRGVSGNFDESLKIIARNRLLLVDPDGSPVSHEMLTVFRRQQQVLVHRWTVFRSHLSMRKAAAVTNSHTVTTGDTCCLCSGSRLRIVAFLEIDDPDRTNSCADAVPVARFLVHIKQIHAYLLHASCDSAFHHTVKNEQDYGSARCEQKADHVEARNGPQSQSGANKPANKGPRDAYEDRDNDASRVFTGHDKLRQDTDNKPHHYPRQDTHAKPPLSFFKIDYPKY
jgi:hypothetical protein